MARGITSGTFNKSKKIIEWLLAAGLIGLLLLGLFTLAVMLGFIPAGAAP